MPRDPDRYDFFVSYARADNHDGWITAFVDQLLTEHTRFSGGRELTYFFDKHDIHSFDDWQHSLSEGLQHSRMFVAFISPNYFASKWCRREWRTWIDLEIAKHILSSGAAPIYFVEVPDFVGKVPGLAEQAMLSEQQVAAKVAELCQVPLPHDPFTGSVARIVHQMRDRRQITSDFVEPFRNQGLEALRRADLQTVLERLERDLDARAEYVRCAAESESTVPPYNKNFSGRLEELLNLRERLKDDRAGVISGVHGLGGVGKTELAFTYAHAFAGAYPGGRFHIECDGKATLHEALLGTGRTRALAQQLPPGRIPRISRLMALAFRFDGLIRAGEVAGYAELAHLAHVTRARITQIMNLLMLAPDIQETILFLPRTESGHDRVHLNQLQSVTLVADWGRQRKMWQRLT